MLTLTISKVKRLDANVFAAIMDNDELEVLRRYASDGAFPGGSAAAAVNVMSKFIYDEASEILTVQIEPGHLFRPLPVQEGPGAGTLVVFGGEAQKPPPPIPEADAADESKRPRADRVFGSANSKVQNLLDALTPLIQDICPGRFHRTESGRWLPQDRNFVIFKLQEARKSNIAITLYGRPSEFESILAKAGDTSHLSFGPGRGSYSHFYLDRLDDVQAAADLIRGAYELKVRRRGKP